MARASLSCQFNQNRPAIDQRQNRANQKRNVLERNLFKKNNWEEIELRRIWEQT